MSEKSHFVAHLKIERVDITSAPSAGRGELGLPKRDVTEVTQLVIKGADLESLIEKLGKHIEIIEEN